MSGSVASSAPSGAQAPSPSGQPSPGQPPIGSSPATGPTQNAGNVAKGMQQLTMLLNGMAMAVPLVGANTPLGQALSKAVVDIGRHIPPGAASPQGEGNAIKEMMLKHQQNRTQMAAQHQAAGGPQTMPPGASGAP